jgi:hypothetical protein
VIVGVRKCVVSFVEFRGGMLCCVVLVTVHIGTKPNGFNMTWGWKDVQRKSARFWTKLVQTYRSPT